MWNNSWRWWKVVFSGCWGEHQKPLHLLTQEKWLCNEASQDEHWSQPMSEVMCSRKTISVRKAGGAAEDAKSKAKEVVSGLKHERKYGFTVTEQDTGVFKVSREKRTMIETGRRAEKLPSPRHRKWSHLQGFHGKKEFWAILESISLGSSLIIPAADRNSPLLSWALTDISTLTLHLEFC